MASPPAPGRRTRELDASGARNRFSTRDPWVERAQKNSTSTEVLATPTSPSLGLAYASELKGPRPVPAYFYLRASGIELL